MLDKDNPDETMLDKPNIVVVTLPLPLHNKAGEVILTKFIKVFEPLSDELFVITGNIPENIKYDEKIHIKSIKYDTRSDSILLKIIKYVMVQVKLSCNLLKIPNKDMVFLMGSGLILPLLSAKLARTKTVVIAIGLQSKSSERMFGGFIFSRIFRILERINYLLVDRIVLESNSAVSFLDLVEYRYKISIGSLYVDLSLFKIIKGLKNRKELVGYVGRYSEEKGIINFVDALPMILNGTNNIKILIGGGGPLLNEIKEKVKKYQDKGANLIDWIPYGELPNYLNELKLLILPSYTEGLPNIVLEAMACGTPVLATPVGGVPDLIKDGETGFVMEENSPECIAENILRVLDRPDLVTIARNAQVLIEKEYTYETALKRYQEILRRFYGNSEK